MALDSVPGAPMDPNTEKDVCKIIILGAVMIISCISIIGKFGKSPLGVLLLFVIVFAFFAIVVHISTRNKDS